MPEFKKVVEHLSKKLNTLKKLPALMQGASHPPSCGEISCQLSNTTFSLSYVLFK